ncbi:nucleotidyltransferase family protein [Chryseolinea sp. H1M3-3]|uniref:nucleotidyltransferase family protein n=1 Tax=Chryseolinea sp. H1M3-3 TaxID=3034144 RepID=UPI0023EAFFE5|nr:nucleotidyltransferase family protein [Chryseolinea sp. H1M3-3]
MEIGIIILAAGSSSRMGRSKQLLEIEGEPLLCRCTKTALAVSPGNVVVILGANEKPHRDVIEKLPVQILSNYYWKTGMGSSIKTGLNFLLQSGAELDAVIIMVCDQPALTADHLLKLIQKFNQNKGCIVASSYGNSNGVPALFGRSFFSNLLLLSDDQGAKKLIQQFPRQLEIVEFPNGLFDLDTEEDYQQYLGNK